MSPEKFVVTFKPGKEMEQRVRELEQKAAAEAQAAAAAATPPVPETNVQPTLYDPHSGNE